MTTFTLHPASVRSGAAHLVAALLLASGLLLAAADPSAAATTGSGRSATETRSLGEFSAVATSASIDIDVRQGSPAAVQVTADDNLLPLLETVVEPGSAGPVLRVRWKRGESVRYHGKAIVSIVVPTLVAVSSSGSGDIRAQGFVVPSFKVTMSGSGDARLDALKTEDLQVSISGSSDVVASGSATKASVSISGSGDVRLGDLKTSEMQVRIAGSGDAEVHADKALSISIAGSGDVRYSGDAAVSTKVAGSGTVRKK